ncbi:hypothetical protein N7505_001141 [Penicillium chrysogenum]|uniref:Uncharacterized protein n=1 Tax=Penicillium chrysogenum TaxID=5076 RepID=A0ABQ8WWU1_PENCH|nr:hypothetical protein N7505_001141 [Penicillium chrysogenum]
MSKPPVPPQPPLKPVQTEEVYDLGSVADNALIVDEILQYIVREDLEDLGGEEIYSRRHSQEKKETEEQRDMLEQVTQGIWGLVQKICSTEDFGSLGLPCIDSHLKQEALRTSIAEGKVNEGFLRKFIIRAWESINDDRKRAKKGQKGQKGKKRQRSSPDQKGNKIDLEDRKWRPDTQPSLEGTMIDNDLQPHEVTFAPLTAITDDLIEKLASPDFHVHKFKSYPTEIQCFGSLQLLKDRIHGCILPEIRQLEGQKVTRKMLDDIHRVQDPLSEWPTIGGYLLYITSSEAEEYWRPYAGQATVLVRRIPQHITEVIHGRINTLCYWVASKPGRQLNFIRLWEITPEEEDTHQSIELLNTLLELLNTLLEMIFCLGFQTLPQQTLTRFLGDQEFSLRGLNVVSPLLQNITLSPSERAEFRKWLLSSPSPETRQFAEARSKELQQKQRSSLQPSSRRSSYTEIEGAFREQIKPYICAFVRGEATDGPSSNLLSPIANTEIGKDVAAYLEQQGVERHLWAFPIGSTEARIGFVLDFDIPSLEGGEERTYQTHFPLALRSVGFHKENCLTWPFNFQAPFVPRKLKLAGPGHTRLRDINRQIIDNSNLQSSFEKRTLAFGQASLEAFLQIEQSVVTRVYLNPLAPLSALYSDDWRSGTMVSLAIKVAACLTRTRGIQPFYFRSRVALSELVRIRLREEDGEPKLTSDSITDSIWSWLYTRGFKPSDIPRLETIGGSVSRGILLAMITSPSRPKDPNKTPEPRIIPRDNPSLFSRKFTKLQLQEMRKLHTQKQAEWDLEHADSTKKLSEGEDGDLLREDEVSEGQEGVNLNEHVLELVTDPTAKRTKTAKHSRKAEPPMATKDSREAGSPATAFQPAKKRTNDTVPPDRRGKDRNCCWCKKPTYGKNTYPCWCEALQGSLCQQCSIILSNSGYLPIFKHHILHLDIFCGFCGFLFGSGWKWEPSSGLPACSAKCHAGLKQKSRRPEAGQQTQRGFRYQDTIPEKLPMTAKLREYFKNKFGIDTTREGLKATAKKNSLVAEL